MAAKIANALGVTVDYLIGSSDHIIMDKGLVRRMEGIEAMPSEEKDKVYYLIDMALAYNKKSLCPLGSTSSAIAVKP